MKALDTPVLLDLLRGAPAARNLVRALGNEDVATTELNLWELGLLAVGDRSSGRDRRLAAVERLRRKLIVIPVDADSIRAAVKSAATGGPRLALISGLIRGALEAHGCTEWITARDVSLPSAHGSLHIEEYGRRLSKSRSNVPRYS